MFELIAHNEQGASVVYHGDTKSEVIKAFDGEYTRSGFKIVIYSAKGSETILKKTFA